jgi:hypothetical protein
VSVKKKQRDVRSEWFAKTVQNALEEGRFAAIPNV